MRGVSSAAAVVGTEPLDDRRGFTEGVRLNDRQRLIVGMLAEGASDTQIARRLYIGQRTVQREVAALMAVVGAASRFALGAEAARRGWL
ncbi:helix-turn-helix transcriptional regulator [Phytomonospora sp. NPDC050363]|uniref:response regulator transcription factor n=1 Tax=Phytomonospora sp. NPDC050363 TaxID=3155642 RepID=UPI0033ECB719